MDETLWDILTSPSHMGAEFVSHIIWDLVLALLLAPLFRRYIKREHKRIDDEHGVDNHGRMRTDFTLTYSYHAGTGRGDDKDTWTCTCGAFFLSKDAGEAHMNYHGGING